MLLRTAVKSLAWLCGPEDQAFVLGRMGEVEGEMGDVSEQTSGRVDVLEQRLKSWQVSVH